MNGGNRDLLVTAAAANVALHLVGLVFALVALRPGSPVVPLDQRVGYLSTGPLGWTLGWGVWILCAVAFVLFVAGVKGYAHMEEVAAAALKLGAAGAAVDILCDLGQISKLPELARSIYSLEDAGEFLRWERRLSMGGWIVANGLYSIAVLLASISVWRRLPPQALALGAATFLSGFVLVWAGIQNDVGLVQPATALIFATFLPWTIAVTRALADGRR